MSVLKEEVKCVVCGEEAYTIIKKCYNTQVSDEMCYVECIKCGLVFMNPRPVRDEMQEYYLHSYYAYNKLDIVKGKCRGSIFDYIKISLLTTVISQSFRELNYIEKCFHALLMLFFDTMAGGAGLPRRKRSGKLLDVGCGDGFFMYIIKQNSKFEVYGIEPGAAGVRKAKEFGLNVTEGIISEFSAPDNNFDVIMMKGSLEHTHHPIKDLEKAYRLLAPGGEIVLGGLPNIKNLYSKIFGTKLEILYDRHHTFLPDYNHVVGMLSRVGFKDIRINFVGVHQFSQGISRLLRPSRAANLIAYNPIFLLFGAALDLYLNTFGNGGGGLEVSATK